MNLFLHVTGKREDGYHILESLIGFATTGDILSFSPSDTLSLSVTGPLAGALASVAPEENIVIKAAKLFQNATGIQKGATITLEKHLPAGAGIGGGSSDAAATLNALEKLWQHSLPHEEKMKLALTLGADVPVCIETKPAYIKGIGEEIVPTSLPSLPMVLAYPAKPLATKTVFSSYTAAFNAPLKILPKRFESTQALYSFLEGTENALEPAATACAPEIKNLLGALAAEQGCTFVRMSGSGSCCFGVFESTDAASAAAQNLAQKKPGWWIHATSLASHL